MGNGGTARNSTRIRQKEISFLGLAVMQSDKRPPEISISPGGLYLARSLYRILFSCHSNLEPFQAESLFALTLLQRTDNERHRILILRDENMLERVHTALGFAQFVRQPPDCGREHRKLRNAQQHIAERGAGFVQNGGGIAGAIEQFRRLAAAL